jgi:hypothetical protein
MVDQVEPGDILCFDKKRVRHKDKQHGKFDQEDVSWQEHHAGNREHKKNSTYLLRGPAGQGPVSKRVTGITGAGIQRHVRDIIDNKAKCR